MRRVHRRHREPNPPLVSMDSVRIRGPVPGSDGMLQLILDGDLDVIDVNRSDG